MEEGTSRGHATGPRGPASMTFEPRAELVGAARRFAMGEAQRWGFQPDAVGLVVGELAANAVLHARSPFVVSLSCRRRRILVEVADANPRLPVLAAVPLDASSGRGLAMVEQVARAWGVRPHPEGKVVWAEMRDG